MIYFAWFLFSIAVGILASNRGRSGLVWFFLSLLLSPLLGLVFCLVSKDLSAAKVQQQPNGQTHRKCPKCAEFIKPEASVCKHCGAEVTPEPERFTSAANALKDEENSNAVLGLSLIAGIVLLLYLFSALKDWIG